MRQSYYPWIPGGITHGGVGAYDLKEIPAAVGGTGQALSAGMEINMGGGDVVDSLLASGISFEDNPDFNCGKGCYRNKRGIVQAEAVVMVARGMVKQMGLVTILEKTPNPIRVAAAVLQTDQIGIGGPDARRFADRMGIPRCRNRDLLTPRSTAIWRECRRRQRQGQDPEPKGSDTAGGGFIAQNFSIGGFNTTGGLNFKEPGRIGDCGQGSTGVYVEWYGVAIASGDGEAIVLATLCKDAIVRLGQMRDNPMEVARWAIFSHLSENAGRMASGGIIILTAHGKVGYATNQQMPVAYQIADGPIVKGMVSGTILEEF